MALLPPPAAGSLRGRTLLITGAARGIGLQIALRAAQDGANVVVAARSDAARRTGALAMPGTIFTAARLVEEAGGAALPVCMDVRSAASVRRGLAAAAERFGGVDTIVHTAHVAPRPSAAGGLSIAGTSPRQAHAMLATNVNGAFTLTRAALPYLLAAPAGSAHILTLAPPLGPPPGSGGGAGHGSAGPLGGAWFAAAGGGGLYAASKLSATIVTMAWAAELRGRVGANTLWAARAISTPGLCQREGAVAGAAGRDAEIMADAAHRILTRYVC